LAVPAPKVEEQLESIAANVRRCRAKLGLTQENLGEVTGFDIRFIQRLERGRINFSIETLVRLAAALEVPPGLLLRKTKLNPPVPGRPARRGRS
jgi:transcriptional regulator with XRE-family HTH domain